MAQFKKGEGGRSKGIPNKVTSLQREFIQSLLDDQQDKIKEELSRLKGKEYLNVVAAFMEYAMPKLNRTELASDEGTAASIQIVGMLIT